MVFSSFDECLASSKESYENLKQLGVKNLKYIGNLKYSENKQDQIIHLDKSFKKQLRNRKIW